MGGAVVLEWWVNRERERGGGGAAGDMVAGPVELPLCAVHAA